MFSSAFSSTGRRTKHQVYRREKSVYVRTDEPDRSLLLVLSKQDLLLKAAEVWCAIP